MAKQTKKQQRTIGKQNKRRGSNFERQIAKQLRELGFSQVVTSRAESKSTDDNKIDIIDKAGQLPFDMQIQTKKTSSTPSYFGIREQSTVDNEKFVILWSKTERRGEKMMTVGNCAMMDLEMFYKLIKPYAENNGSIQGRKERD